MKVSILEAQRVIMEKDAGKVVLPASDGELCVLNFHQPFVSCLKKGRIVIDNTLTLPIIAGVARMRANALTVMVER